MLGNGYPVSDSDTPGHAGRPGQHGVGWVAAHRWKVAFGVAVLVSLVVLFTPESGVPPAIPGTDKLVHLALFGALAGTGRLSGAGRRWLVPALLAYAVSSEVIQASDLLGRSASVADVIADTLGVVFGLLFALRWRRRHA